MPEEQPEPFGRHPVAAWAGMGATIEATTGTATTAETAKTLISSRRLIPVMGGGLFNRR